jgi:tetratricopeptide (TPR) repeat protein
MKFSFIRLSQSWASAALLILAVAVPLLYLPISIEPRELIKQTLLVLVVMLTSLSLVATIIQTRTITIRRDWGYLLFILLIIALLVTPGLRESPYLSLMGQAGQEYTSVLSFISFGLLFFVGAEYLKTPNQIRRLLCAALIGGSLISLFTLPTFIGVTWLPNIVGTPNALAVYLVSMMSLGLGLWLTNDPEAAHSVIPSGLAGKVVHTSIAVTSFTTIATLLAIDYTPLWVLLLVGLGSLFLIAFIKTNHFKQHSRFVLPMLLFGLGVIFAFLPSPINSPFLAEVLPTQSASLAITTSTLQDGSLLFGTGAGTYGFDYAAHHSPTINQTYYWDSTFSQGSSYFLTLLPTLGLIGTGLYLLICLSILGGSLLCLFNRHHTLASTQIIVPLTAWLVLFAAQFLVSSNMTLTTIFWLLSAVLAALSTKKLYEAALDKSPRTSLAATFLAVCFILVVITTLFITGSRYAAELSFKQAVTLSQTGGSQDSVIVALDHAAVINRWSDIYYRNLAHALLQKTATALKQPKVDQTYIQQLISASINAAQRATELSSNNVANWLALGDTYQEISPVITDALPLALAAYQAAHSLAPNNPRHLVSLAKANTAIADAAAIVMQGTDKDLAAAAKITQAAALDAGLAALLTAQKLKPDYATAGYYLAGIYERQGKLADAIAGLEAIRTTNPNDVGVGVQLALLYIKQGKNNLAKTELLRVLTISPNYADAHWYLATILENEADLEGAIIQVEAVALSNPNNELVKTRLSRLRQGLADKLLPPPLEPTLSVDQP